MTTSTSASCILIGEESLLIQCAQTLLDRGHAVKGILTSDAGIEKWARDQEIAVGSSRGDLLPFLEAREFDYLFSVANLRMLAPEVIGRARKLAINFHDGPLPRYAGLYATNWALLGGESEHGVTWHEMVAEADRGRILSQRVFEILPEDTAFGLNARCYATAVETFGELVDRIGGDSLEFTEQDFSRRSYFGRRERPERAGILPLEQSADELDRFFRALDFGANYENPLTTPKIILGGRVVLVGTHRRVDTRTGPSAGTVLRLGEDEVVVATGTEDLALGGFSTSAGREITVAALRNEYGLREGDVIPQPSAERAARISELNREICVAEERWAERLVAHSPPDVPYADRSSVEGSSPRWAHSGRNLPAELVEALGGADGVITATGIYLARLCGQSSLRLGYRDRALADRTHDLEELFAGQVPLPLEIDPATPFAPNRESTVGALEAVRADGTFARDAIARRPSVPVEAGTFPVVITEADFTPTPGCELAIQIDPHSGSLRWHHDERIYSTGDVLRMQNQFEVLATAASRDGDTPVRELPLLSPEELERVLRTWNDTAVDYDHDACIHEQFEARVRQHPDAVALRHESLTLTYAELNARANRLAARLRKLGVGPDVLVGIATARDVDLVTAVLGVQKAGGAYVPLDPEYPADRIAFMIEDAKISVLLTQEALAADLPPAGDAQVLRLDADWDALVASESDADLEPLATSSHLAYVIYTSGSTGKPKGVMVEHRNAVNFFVGMDERIPHDPPGVWLSVTSLSFDISVLELSWTLTRGFEVVIYGGGEKVGGGEEAAPAKSAIANAARPIEYSLFYFSSDEGERAQDKYRLLLDGARYADENGFVAVWTPERHFHAFGGLYPNPSVTSAAVATITKNVQLRSGSCVAPLHSPIRIAEEWALVDNLSNGRVAISFAAGWQPNDFVLFPDNYARRKEIMFETIDQVQRLWRGESVAFVDGTGKEIEIRTLPRPVQETLPVWVTAAGNPETFRAAGERGENILTHLLGQSLDELVEKVRVYREAWKAAGHPGRGHISLMLHTFVGHDDDEVKETVREPMKEYLKSSVMLIQKAAWSFPTFKQQTTNDAGKFSLDELDGEQLDAVLDFSFERYYETSGLFGTVETCIGIADDIKGCDVDEIACLIDFGVGSDLALEHLPLLNEVRQRTAATSAEGDAPAAPVAEGNSTIAELVERHGVTHLQCTPSMASMLLASGPEREALGKIRHLYVGGEALPPPLAEGLREAMPAGTILNMYGPTETTIWSSTEDVTPPGEITIGTPIANTQIYILDENLQLVPPGVPGELCIGGDGVVRGYLDRPELTAERFVPDPYPPEAGHRLYRTGDLARHREDGVLEFISRMDHQVKVRGYRIELGEIETLLGRHAQIRECVVVAREDTPGDKRLVAYFLATSSPGPEAAALREHLRETLPEFMVPTAFVELERFPLTPNLKVDRKALPAPASVQPLASASPTAAPPSSDLEKTIAEIWQDVLNLPSMGLHDNFFDLGGHSLLTLQVHTRLKEAVETKLTLVDMFKYPTISSLAGFITEEAGGGKQEERKEKAEQRAQGRRSALGRRRKARQGKA